MNIDFQTLERAMAPLVEIGQDEVTFEAGHTTVTLRVLTPEEELAVQRYAAGSVVDQQDTHGAQEFLDRFQTAVLSYAIVALGETDLRGVTLVNTGEVLPNGKPVSVPKHKAMRDLLTRWTRPVMDSVFRKYGEALDKVEQKASKAIHFEPADLTTEIERLEARVTLLKEERERRANPTRGNFSNMMNLATSASQEAKRDREEGLETLRITREPAQNPLPEEVQTRQPKVPEQGTPPVRIDQPLPAIPAEKPPQPATPMSGSRGSLVESDDMQDAVAEETQRIMERRRLQALEQMRLQRPPHADAAEVEQQEQTLAKAHLMGTKGGLEAYRMPTQNLDAVAPTENAPLQRPVDGGSVNPRFRPPAR
jgi:hypothetical protein